MFGAQTAAYFGENIQLLQECYIFSHMIRQYNEHHIRSNRLLRTWNVLLSTLNEWEGGGGGTLDIG